MTRTSITTKAFRAFCIVIFTFLAVLCAGQVLAQEKKEKKEGGGVGKMFEIGSQKMNTKLEAYYNAVKPDGAPDWFMSWTLQFLFPR